MAARSPSPVPLILSITAAVAFAVASLALYQAYSEQVGVADRAGDRARAEEDRARELLRQVEALREAVGHPEAEDFETLMTAVDADLRRLAPHPEGPSPPNYAAALERIENMLETERSDNRQVRQQLADARAHIESLEAMYEEGIAAAGMLRDQALADLADSDAAAQATISDIEQTTENLQERLRVARYELAQLSADRERERAQLESEVERLAAWLNVLRREHAPELENNAPDGSIVRTSLDGRTAWVNLGSADGLREQLTFQVYDRDPARRAQPKGTIQILRIMGPHLSEARLQEASAVDPVLRDDVIANPIWSPGQRGHVAIAGAFDIDGDGRDDRELVRQIIERAGGAIDAELLPTGEVVGEITVDTRWFLVGDEPAETEGNRVWFDSFSELDRLADRYGLTTTRLERFLEHMGHWSAGAVERAAAR